MHPTRCTLALALALSLGATLHTVDALACTPLPPPPGRVDVVTRGTLAQSADLLVDYSDGRGNGELVLTDADGVELPITPTRSETFSAFGADGLIDSRIWYAPETPLATGDYTLEYVEEDPIAWPGVQGRTRSTFTLTEDLPDDATPAPPTLTRTAVLFDGPEDTPLFEEEGPCGIANTPNTTTAIYQLNAVAAPGTAPGFITLTPESSTRPVAAMSGPGGRPAALRTRREFGDEPLHIQCISATFTDVYGRTSEPARSCQPDTCAARHRNDSRAIDGTVLQGCSDWSPGYVERNAPGCACAQAPGAPSGSPVALAVALLGLVGLRRRR